MTLRWLRPNVTPATVKREIENKDKELLERLRRQLAAERRVLLSGR